MYTCTTHNIKVTVIPTYLTEQSEPAEQHFVWAYTIKLENLSDVTVQIMSRYWHITDATGSIQEVRGPGVIGEQPVIEPGDTYQYSSGAALKTPSGVMVGTYELSTPDGASFLIDIPLFSLDSPMALERAN